MQHIRGKLSRALFMVLGLLVGFALKSYGEVKFGDAYDHFYNSSDSSDWVGLFRPQTDLGTDVKVNLFGADKVYNNIAVEVLGCKDVELTPESVEYIYGNSLAKKLVQKATVLTDSQMKARVYREPNQEGMDGSAFLEAVNGENVWEKDVWPNGAVNEDRKWIIIPISRGSKGNGYWGGLPSFSVKLNCNDSSITSDTYYVRKDSCALPELTGKDVFGLECKQYNDGGFGVMDSSGEVTYAYWTGNEDYYGYTSRWGFFWKGNINLPTYMTIKIPEAGHLVICGQYSYRENNAVTTEKPWTISGTGVEELSREESYGWDEIKLNCKQATTVTLSTSYLYNFLVDKLAFYPADTKSVCFVADHSIVRRVSEEKEWNAAVYLNGYATGGGTYKAGETLKMVAHPAPGFALDHWEITDQEYWGSTSTISFPEGTSTVSETLTFEVPESFCGSMDDEKTIRVRPIFTEANSIPAEGWPEWAHGTWAGQVLNNVPDKGLFDGFYKLTLSETEVQEFYKFNDEEKGYHRTNAWKNVKITEQEDCHIVLSCWYWSDTGEQKFDATMVLRKDGCTHYDKSSCSVKNREDNNETVEVKELAKLEMNTAPAKGWPEWVLGKWTGPLDIWIPDQDKTYYGYSVFTLDSTTNQWKVIWDDDDPDKDDSLLGWKITEQKDCHIVATAWCWDEDGDRVYDVKCVFRKPDTDCADYEKSSASIKERNILKEHNDGKCETGNVSLTKDEDNLVPAEGWPEWALGTWKGNVVNVVPDDPDNPTTYKGTYKLTLTSTGSKERYEFEGEDPIDVTDDMFGWKITEKADCHIVATAWCWDDEEDDKFDATYVLCNPDVNCSHYSKSTFHQEQRKDNDKVDCDNLVKDIRVVCHYTNIAGVAGRELRKPNGDHYFGVDWFDYDSAQGKVSGDNDPDLIQESGNWLVGNPSTFAAAYTGTNKDESKKEKPSDTQGWYNDWDSYYPIIVTPTKEGVYEWTRTYIWYDGNPGDRTKWHSESITITFDIKEVPTVAASAENVSTVYDGAAHGIAVKVTSPEDGVTVMYSAESAEGPWQNTSPTVTEVGTKRIWYYAVAEEYLGVTNSATVTISPRKISDVKVDVELPSEGYYKYDATAKSPTATVTDTSFEGFEDSDYEITYEDNVNAGEARVIVTGSGKHYAGAVTNVFTILPRSVTLTSGSKEWAWDGKAKSCEDDPTISGDGFVDSEGATYSDFASFTAPGTYENTFKYELTDGTLASNYEITKEYGKLTIYNYQATENGDGTITIDGLGGEPLQSTELSIPETINGKPVTEIKAQAFVNSDCGVETLKLSKYCKKIGASAFRGIKSLKKVIFVQVYNTDDTPTTLEVGAYAFGSSDVEEIVVPEYVSNIGDYAFSNCSNLKKVSVKAGTAISEKAFYRSGLNVRKKPDVITFSTFTYAGNTATMKVTSTGGTIVLTNLKIYFSTRIGAEADWKEVTYDTSDITYTDTGCEVTVTVTVPESATSGGYFTAVLSK